MSKKTNAIRVINYLNKYSVKFEILDSNGDYPIHIRVGGLDIWPSTGSFRENGVSVKKDINQLMDRLKSLNVMRNTKASVVAGNTTLDVKKECLEKRLLEVESALSFLELKVENLTLKLAAKVGS